MTEDDLLAAAYRMSSETEWSVTACADALRVLVAEGHITITKPAALTLIPVVATTTAAEVYAVAVVTEINRLTGRKFKVTAETITRAKALMRAKVPAETMLAVVKFMHGKWGAKPDMAEYVQPSTLMRVSNARKYIEMMEAGPVRGQAAQTFSTFGND